MSVLQSGGGIIERPHQLVEFLEAGCKPKAAWRIGTEHEKFAYRQGDHAALPYADRPGIRELLEGLRRFGWEPVREGETLIGLKQDSASISLEPGGQFELSGAPLETLHQTCNEVHTHLHQVKTVAEEMGAGFLGLGFHPKARRDDIPIMPKGRYDIMRRYMPKRGTLGLDMMLRTCTVQANLDFSSEADMRKKMRVSLALQPVATALFANSPFTEGKPNGFVSYRAFIWTDTDPDRTGDMPFAFEEGFGFERYVEYALDVPMYFVYRDGRYVDAAGQSFREFMAGRLPALPGEVPTMDDWANHLTTLFPEVRLKRYIEMRGADGGPFRRLCALPAFWVGLLYDDAALEAAWELVRDWTEKERADLRAEVCRTGLKTPFRNRTVGDVARDALDISRSGLKARALRDRNGDDESVFLDTLFGMVETGRTQAEELLALYNGPWQGKVDRVFEEFSY